MSQHFAIFGGSFDPPHLGHLRIIESALTELKIDKLFVVPTFLNPFKNSFCFSPPFRLKWLRILCESLPQSLSKKVEVLDYEVRQNAPVPTFKTLQFIQQTYFSEGKIYLLLGADNVESLPQWQNFDAIQKSVEFVIIARKGFGIPQGFKTLPFCEIEISSTEIREKLVCGDFEGLSYFIPQVILELILKEVNCKKIDKK